MKFQSILACMSLLAASLNINAQNANNSQTEEFEVDGIKVILRHSVKGTVSARLMIAGGVANYPQEKEGVEDLALSLVSSSGPADWDKEEFVAQTEAIGARISGSSAYDYAHLSLNCVAIHWDEAWDIFQKTVVNPAFRETDFSILKERHIVGLRQASTNPDSHLRNMAFANAWKGTDYGKMPDGTVESVGNLTLDDLQAHYHKVVNKANIFLVIVGDVKSYDVKAKVEASLAKLKSGYKAPPLYAGESIAQGLTVEERKMETNYILGLMDAPERGTLESIYNSLAFTILGNRFFEELRTKRSLSYAPRASTMGNMARPMNQIYISTTDPATSLQVMMQEVNKAKADGFTSEELKGMKQTFLTHYYMGQESNSSIAMSLAINELNGGWEKADQFTEQVLKATIADVNSVLKNYGNTIYWSYLGISERLETEMFTQPEQPKKIKN